MKEQDKQKIIDFINHLLSLPNIAAEPALIGEGLILNFIVQNMNQLKATFKTPQFFPHLEWNQALQYLLSELYERIAKQTIPIFERFIESSDTSVLNKIYDSSGLPDDFHKEKLTSFLNKIFKNKDVRYNLNSALNMIQHGIIDKYLIEIYKRRESLYNELVRVQKMNLECDEYIMLLKVMAIIKNAIYLKMPIESGAHAISIYEAVKTPGKGKKIIVKAADFLTEDLPNISKRVLSLSLKSNLKEAFINSDDTSSKFLFIMSSRFHNYKPLERIDRGAESPDKSWFAIARKNAEYYGFDKRMLDSLYIIAGDNNW